MDSRHLKKIDKMRWVKKSKRGFAVYRPYKWSDYIWRLFAFGISVFMAFICLDSYIAIGICIVLTAFFLLTALRPTAFCVNCRKGQVINEFLKSFPISDLQIIEKLEIIKNQLSDRQIIDRQAIIKNQLVDLSHLSDEEMTYIKERLPEGCIEPDGSSPEAVYVNHLIMRAIESKAQVRISRTNLISIPELDIDAATIGFDNIKAHCKKLKSYCEPMHVVWHKEKKQEVLIQFEIDEDDVYISVKD